MLTGLLRLPIEGAILPSNLPITIFAFLLTLGLVVVVHELGHFLFCKLFGVYVKTFSIGIGPKFLRKRWGETEYVLSAIPFGGYVKMAGEGIMEEIQDTGTWEERKYPMGTEEGNAEAAGLDDHIPLERHFHSRPAWQRFLVFVAGPLFNLILSFVIYTLLVLSNGLQTIPFTQIGEVTTGSPAETAGLLIGDQIITVDGAEVRNWSGVTFGMIPEANLEETSTPPVEVIYERDGLRGSATIAPIFDEESQRWNLGLRPWNTTVGLVQRGGPADKMGIEYGDVIQRVSGKAVTSFSGIAEIINESPDTPVLIEWVRDGQAMSGEVTPELTEIAPGEFKGRIFMEPFFGFDKVGLGESLKLGYSRTGDTIKVTVGVLGNFVRRELGLDA
ncbi:MAG: regulator of sigma E protease, partial [Candidatus Krumholzibacteriia bacterium]